MTTQELVTHSGFFHADEVFSYCVLNCLFPTAELTRSRDPEDICVKPGRIVFDVGLHYAPELGMFDHHQPGRLTRQDGTPYSAFGLVWKHFGSDFLKSYGIPEEHVSEVHDRIDRSLVYPIDLLDNSAADPSEAGRMVGITIPEMIEALNPPFDLDDVWLQGEAFLQAAQLAKTCMDGTIQKYTAELRAENTVRRAIAECGQGVILDLPRQMPFERVLRDSGADHILFVRFPQREDWALATVRVSENNFTNKMDLPAAWAGLSGEDLAAVTSVPDAVFCHANRFLAIAKSRDGILEMSRQIEEDLKMVSQIEENDLDLV